jgi:hypothetical protein
MRKGQKMDGVEGRENSGDGKTAEAPNGKQRKARSDDQKLADALRRKQQLEAQIAKLKSTKTAKDKRLEARRAFIVGQAVLTHRATKGATDLPLPAILDEHVKKPGDREVIADLLAAA